VLRRQAAARVAALIAVVGSWGCGEPEPEPAPAWCEEPETDEVAGMSMDVVSYGVDLDEVCLGSYLAAERHAQWVAAQWGDGQFFDHVLYDSVEEPCWPCVEPYPACTRYGAAHATTFPERHEIAHAVRPGACFPLLEEGWAVLYGSYYYDYHITSELVEDALQHLEETGDVLGHYGLAGRFVAFLLERNGVDALRELCAIDIESTAEFDAALQQTHGASLETLTTEFADFPKASGRHLLQEIACEVGDQSVVTSPGSWAHDLRCGQPQVEGRRGQWLMSHQLVEIPADGAYAITVTTAQELSFEYELRSCTYEHMASLYSAYSPRTTRPDDPSVIELSGVDELTAGLHVFRIRLDDRKTDPAVLDQVTFEVSIAPTP